MSITITIVVPAFNTERFLARCIESILSQTYDRIEILLVDDGSTDKTGRICDELAASNPNKVKVIHTTNCGVSSARLSGIEAASGEWIGFVDSDDVIEPDMYERLLLNAEEYNADISHCGYRTIVNDGERVHYFYNTGRLILQDQATGLKDLLEGSFIEPGLCNKLFHKTLFQSLLHNRDKVIGIRENEDLLMNYYLFKEAKLSVFEDYCPYCYMAHSSSATRSGFQVYKVLDPVKVRKLIYEDIQLEFKDVALSSYLFSCRRAYEALMRRGTDRQEAVKIKKEMLSYRSQWELLRKSEQLRIRLLLNAPHVYMLLENLYERLIQAKKYE